MKHYYSIVVFAITSRQYQEPLIFIEPGINAFTVTTDAIDALVSNLRADGHRIDEVNQLDGSEAHVVGRLSS